MPEIVPCGLCGSLDAHFEPMLTRFAQLVEPYRVQGCLRCGFVYESPRPTRDELVQMYQATPFWKAERNAKRPHRRRFDADRFARVERWTRGPGSLMSLATLDGGYVMENARRRGWETLGVEFVEGAIEHVDAFGLPMVRSNLWDLDVVDRQFDAILTTSLEHMPDVPATLRQMREHLRPGGAIVIEAPNQFEAIKERVKLTLLGIVGDRLLDYAYTEPDQVFHLSYFSPRTLRSAVEEAGFEVLELRTYMPWNPLYHYTRRFHVTKELVYLLGGFFGRGPSIELIARAA